jgi:flagellar M-ring protein FliF
VLAWLIGLRDVIAEATPARRLMLALLVLLPLASLAAAYVWFNPPAYRVLYEQLSDRAGGEVIGALEQLDIPYRLASAGGTIEVPATRLHEARYRLAARGLPRSDADVEDEVVRAPRFGASSLEEQQRYRRVLETDLARSIQALDAVDLARVHLAVPKVSPFLRDAPATTAAVLVRVRSGAKLDAAQIETIQTLVAASVPRMKRSDVQVLDPRGVLLGGSAPEADQSQRLALEQDLARRVLAVLAPWLGAERVNVQVTATLADSDTEQTVEQVRNVVLAGQAHPTQKTVRTTRIPEGRVQRLNAIVILGFDASADERQRVAQLARQVLGLTPARGDTLSVYAMPAVEHKSANIVHEASVTPPVPAPLAAPVAAPPAGLWPAAWPWLAAVALVVFALLAMRRPREPAVLPVVEMPADNFDVLLESARTRALDDPRVTADVVKLWMRT